MDNEIKEELIEIKTELRSIGTTLAVNTESLTHHMARTASNEARIVKVENWLLGILTSGVLGALGIIAHKVL
jgi:hypothetical protein